MKMSKSKPEVEF